MNPVEQYVPPEARRSAGWILRLLPLATIIFLSGGLALTIKQEVGARAALLQHEARDDERVKDLSDRIKRMEDAMVRLNSIDNRLSRIEGALDGLKKGTP